MQQNGRKLAFWGRDWYIYTCIYIYFLIFLCRMVFGFSVHAKRRSRKKNPGLVHTCRFSGYVMDVDHDHFFHVFSFSPVFKKHSSCSLYMYIFIRVGRGARCLRLHLQCGIAKGGSSSHYKLEKRLRHFLVRHFVLSWTPQTFFFFFFFLCLPPLPHSWM